jgi:DNA-binding protein H-NS
MTTLDELLAELSQTLIKLEQEPAGDARATLERRRDELREALRDLDIDRQRPTSELLEEHSRLAARLKQARGERVKKVGTKYLGATQTVGGGVAPTQINRMIDEGNRFDDLADRFDHLTEILESRGALDD